MQKFYLTKNVLQKQTKILSLSPILGWLTSKIYCSYVSGFDVTNFDSRLPYDQNRASLTSELRLQ